jgi:hypothetical protein
MIDFTRDPILTKKRISELLRESFLDDAAVVEELTARLGAHASALRSDPAVAKRSVALKASHSTVSLSWEQDQLGSGFVRISVIASPGDGENSVVDANIVHPEFGGKRRFSSVEEFIKYVRGL